MRTRDSTSSNVKFVSFDGSSTPTSIGLCFVVCVIPNKLGMDLRV